jgi:hypothetical protein
MDYRRCSVYFRRLVGLGALTALLVTTVAPAMAASQSPTTDSPSFSTKSIAKAVANTTPAAGVSANSPSTPAAKTTPQAGKSSSFFKTRTGLVVIAVMALGTGYAVYSAKEDRIRGSIR